VNRRRPDGSTLRLRTTRRAPVGAYVPGTSLLHRSPALVKVLLLAAFSTVLALWRAPVPSTTGLLVAVAAALGAGLPRSLPLRVLRGMAPIVVVFGTVQWWQNGWESAVGIIGGILAAVMAAAVVTATTTVDEMMRLVVVAARPLRVLGLSEERLALAFGLTLRMMPVFEHIAAQTREAARARGLERDRRALLVPLALRAVAHTQRTGEALAARGLGD
jgi:biotin transport system permease protein